MTVRYRTTFSDIAHQHRLFGDFAGMTSEGRHNTVILGHYNPNPSVLNTFLGRSTRWYCFFSVILHVTPSILLSKIAGITTILRNTA